MSIQRSFVSHVHNHSLRQQDEFIQCDFTSEDQLVSLGDALRSHKFISALVHCAGLMHTMPSNKLSVDYLKDMFFTNTIAPAF